MFSKQSFFQFTEKNFHNLIILLMNIHRLAKVIPKIYRRMHDLRNLTHSAFLKYVTMRLPLFYKKCIINMGLILILNFIIIYDVFKKKLLPRMQCC